MTGAEQAFRQAQLITALSTHGHNAPVVETLRATSTLALALCAAVPKGPNRPLVLEVERTQTDVEDPGPPPA